MLGVVSALSEASGRKRSCPAREGEQSRRREVQSEGLWWKWMRPASAFPRDPTCARRMPPLWSPGPSRPARRGPLAEQRPADSMLVQNLDVYRAFPYCVLQAAQTWMGREQS